MLPAMRVSRAWFFANLFLAGCGSKPDAPALVPLPPQRQLVAAADLPYEPAFVYMSERRASRMILRDIGPPGLRTWTGPAPAMRFTLPEPGEWRAEVHFNAVSATLKDTGPILVTFAVDGKPIGRMRVSDDSAKTFTATLQLEGTQAELSFSVDKPWVAPEDGAKLGVLLQAMGFKRQAQ